VDKQKHIQLENFGQNKTTANSGLAKGGLTSFVETFVQGSTFVLRINFSAKNPALRQAAKRYKLTDISPFFHCTWFSYFGSLFLTLLLEVLLGLIFFYKNRGDKTLKSYLLTFILANVVTHFSLWVVYSNAFIPLFFLELLIVTIEFMYWKIYLKVSSLKAFLISLLTNFGSWTIGGLLTFFV
jgi:hypothetical protein